MKRAITASHNLLLIALLLAGLWMIWGAAEQIWRNPLLRPMIERSLSGFEAEIKRELARGDTAAELQARLDALLLESPRDWMVIEAIEELARDTALPLSASYHAARSEAWATDSGYLAIAQNCGACMWDAASCTLSQAMICNVPFQMTPIGDVAGIAKAGVAYIWGEEVDHLDLTLSAVGLAATAGTVVTGGSSATIKLGTSLLKLARRMALLSPKMTGLLIDAARNGLRWDEMPGLAKHQDLSRLINPEKVKPLTEVVTHMGSITDRLDTAHSLALLKYVDGPADARRIAKATEVMDRKTLGALEVLGKSRFMRAALRWGDEAIALILGFLSAAAALAGLIAASLHSWTLRQLRKNLRRHR